VEQQQRNGDHLGRGLDLAERAHRHRLARADLGHPFAQRRDGDFAADDDEGDDRVTRPSWTSTSSAPATISLSATGSRKAPKAEVWFQRRAR
jgi:hypothetical protein